MFFVKSSEVTWAKFQLLSENPHTAFETLTRIYFKQTVIHDVNFPLPQLESNNPGLETDPIFLNDKNIGFQSKYFVAPRVDYPSLGSSIDTSIAKYGSKLDILYIYCNRSINRTCKSFLAIKEKCERLNIDLAIIDGPTILDSIISDKSLFYLADAFFSENKTLPENYFKRRAQVAMSSEGKKYNPALFSLSSRAKEIENEIFFLTEKEVEDELKSEIKRRLTLFRTLIRGNNKPFITLLSNILPIFDKLLDCGEPSLRFSGWQEAFSQCRELCLDYQKNQDKDLIRKNDSDVGNRYEDLCSLINLLDYQKASRWQRATASCHLIEAGFGIGKTALMLHWLNEHAIHGTTRMVLVFGKDINYSEKTPRETLSAALSISYDIEIFLKQCEAYGQAYGQSTFIIIDALNECAHYEVWQSFISELFLSVRELKFVKLVITLRESYHRYIFGNHDEYAEANYALHRLSWRPQEIKDLMSGYFHHYNIRVSSISKAAQKGLSNPLFLRLFCASHKGESLGNLSDVRIDELMLDYLETEDEKYRQIPSVSLSLGLDLFSQLMVEQKRPFVEQKRFEGLLIHNNLSNQTIDCLSKSDLISLGNRRRQISFCFEKVQDVFCAKVLVPDNSEETVARSRIASFLAQPLSGFLLNTLSEAITLYRNHYEKDPSFLLELIETLPDDERLALTRCYFSAILHVEGLNWSRLLSQYRANLSSKEIIETMLSIYSNRIMDGEPVDQAFWDDLLTEMPLATRDYVWSIPISISYEQYEEVYDLLQFLKDKERVASLPSTSRKSLVHFLTWMFSSPNRELRDKATKTIVNLLLYERKNLHEYIRTFIAANDAYILQRLLASSYGALASQEQLFSEETIKESCKLILDQFFATVPVFADILVRDYARGFVEQAIDYGYVDENTRNLVRPPYSSQNSRIPHISDKDIIPLYPNPYDKNKNYHLWGTEMIRRSMKPEMNLGSFSRDIYGDFGRYTFDSSLSYFFPFSNRLKFRSQRINTFKYAYWYIVAKLGYDNALFSDFDSTRRFDRNEEGSRERIGKKYEWLAMYHVLAMLSDTNKIEDSYGEDGPMVFYQGPWNLGRRDIDPTQQLLNGERQYPLDFAIFAPGFGDWAPGNKDWFKANANGVDPLPIISPTDSLNRQWLCISGSFESASSEDYKEKRQSIWTGIESILIPKESFASLISHLPDTDFPTGNNFLQFPSDYQLFSREYCHSYAYASSVMKGVSLPINIEKEGPPEPSSIPYIVGDQIVFRPKLVKTKIKTKICDSYLMATQYSWESQEDYSIKRGIFYRVPTQIIVDMLSLKQLRSGEWVDENGDIALCDFALFRGTNLSGLYLRADKLSIIEERYSVLWKVVNTVVDSRGIMERDFDRKVTPCVMGKKESDKIVKLWSPDDFE